VCESECEGGVIVSKCVCEKVSDCVCMCVRECVCESVCESERE